MLRTEEPYTVLAVSSSVSSDQIRHAYHRLAKQLHPDRNKTPGAEEAFKRVSAAHQLLTDDTRRCRYDAAQAFAARRRSQAGEAGTPTTQQMRSGAAAQAQGLARQAAQAAQAAARARAAEELARRAAAERAAGER